MNKNLLLSFALVASYSWAQTEPKVLTADTIQVDGYVKEKKVEDQELAGIKAEINKQKQEIVLNKEKSKSFKELSKSVEKLSEATVEYLEEKKAAQAEIGEYNAKVKCLQAENPGSECDKYIRHRR